MRNMHNALDRSRRAIPFALLASFLLAISGCGTVVYDIRDEQDLSRVNVTETDGLVVARIHTDFSGVRTAGMLGLPESVVFEFKDIDASAFAGPEELIRFATWQPLVVIKVPAGTYRWEALRFRWLTYTTPLEGTTFDVTPGSFNYVGDLSVTVIEDADGTFYAQVSSTDNVSDIPARLSTRFPESGDDIPLVSAVSEVSLKRVQARNED